MSEWFADGRIVDLILVVILFEGIAFLVIKRLSSRGPALTGLLTNLAAGGSLVVALGLALADAEWRWIALWLTLAGIAHLADVLIRWRSARDDHQNSA